MHIHEISHQVNLWIRRESRVLIFMSVKATPEKECGEGCRFRFYTNNIVQGPERRRYRYQKVGNTDNYSSSAHSQGLTRQMLH